MGHDDRDPNNVDNQIRDDRSRIKTQDSQFYNDVNTRLKQSQSRADQAWNTAYGGYSDFLKNYSPGGAGYNSIYDKDRVGKIDAGTARIRGDANDYRGFAHGDSPAGAVYGGLMKDGGYDDKATADFRSRATSTIPSFYDALKQNMDRTNRIQGDINPGYTSQSAAMARDAGQQAQKAATVAETELHDRIQAGKLEGARGYSSNYATGMAGAVGAENTANQTDLELARYLQANGLQMGQLQLSGLAGLRGLRTDVPGEEKMNLDAILQGRQIGDNALNNTITQQGNQDARGFNKIKTILGALGSGLSTGIGAGSLPSFGGGQQNGTNGQPGANQGGSNSGTTGGGNTGVGNNNGSNPGQTGDPYTDPYYDDGSTIPDNPTGHEGDPEWGSDNPYDTGNSNGGTDGGFPDPRDGHNTDSQTLFNGNPGLTLGSFTRPTASTRQFASPDSRFRS